MSTRRNLTLLVLVSLLIAFAFGFAMFTSKFAGSPAPRIEIPVDGQVTLRAYAMLTPANKEIFVGKKTSWAWIYNRLPTFVQAKFPSFRPKSGHSISLYSSNSGDCALIMETVVPPDWYSTLTSYQIQEKINKALETQGMRRSRFVTPMQLQSQDEYLYAQTEDWSSMSGGGGPKTCFRYLRIPLNKLPVFEKDIRIQFLPEWRSEDTKNKVTKEVTMANPLYQKVSLVVTAPSPLPVTVKDKNIEFTVRALIGKVSDQRREVDPDNPAFIADKPIPKSGAVSPEYFPRAADPRDFKTILLADITSAGLKQDEWGLDRLEITYGLEKFRFMDDRRSKYKIGKTEICIFPADITLYPQPVQISANLIRKENFPPDESQTVELPLPAAGQHFETSSSVTLWDNSIEIPAIAYKKNYAPAGRFHLVADPRCLSIFYLGNKQVPDTIFELIGPDGKTADITHKRGGSSMTVDRGRYQSVVSYDPDSFYGGGNTAPVNYDDYTTARITFRSPRTYPRKFEFTVKAEEATGTEPSR